MHLDKVVQLSCANIGFRDVKKQGLIALLEIGLMEGHFFCAMLEGILTLMELDLACVKSRSALSYLRKGFFCFKGSLLGHVLHLLALSAKGFTVLLVLLDHKMKSFKEIPPRPSSASTRLRPWPFHRHEVLPRADQGLCAWR